MTSRLADRFDGFLIDLDGVVWVGDRALPGSVAALAVLRDMRKAVLFLTNDSRSSRDEHADRLRRMGVEVHRDAILTSGRATASIIAERRQGICTRVFVVGTAGLKTEMTEGGLSLADDDATVADVVVVSGHNEFTYSEMRTASLLIRQGADFYATGRDATFPMPDGPWPGTGAVVAAIETASGVTASVIGKPEPHMFSMARSLMSGCERVVVVGDTPASDIEGGQRAGLPTILVAAHGTEPAGPVTPNYVVSSLSDLVT